jgi:hypothetical protein
MEYRQASLGLDVRCPDYRCPFFGLLDDDLVEVGRRRPKGRGCESASNFDPSSFCHYVIDLARGLSIFQNVHRRPTVTPAILKNKAENQRVGMAPPAVRGGRLFT